MMEQKGWKKYTNRLRVARHIMKGHSVVFKVHIQGQVEFDAPLIVSNSWLQGGQSVSAVKGTGVIKLSSVEDK